METKSEMEFLNIVNRYSMCIPKFPDKAINVKQLEELVLFSELEFQRIVTSDKECDYLVFGGVFSKEIRDGVIERLSYILRDSEYGAYLYLNSEDKNVPYVERRKKGVEVDVSRGDGAFELVEELEGFDLRWQVDDFSFFKPSKRVFVYGFEELEKFKSDEFKLVRSYLQKKVGNLGIICVKGCDLFFY